MKKRNQGILRQGKGLTSAVLITIMLLTGSLHGLAATNGFTFEDWDTVYSREFDGRRKENRMTTPGEAEPERLAAASGSEIPATSSMALSAVGKSSLGDIWDNWNGDFSFLDGTAGDGSEKKPYQIKNKNQLMGLAQLAAMGMRVQPGEGNEEIIGSYDGKHFRLMSNIDLGGMEWNPIGYFRDSSEFSGEITNKFFGSFDGNGKTISNFRLNRTSWNKVGFFGAIEDAAVKNLTLKPGKTVCGQKEVAILAGSAVNSKITGCTVSGSVSASGTSGGITAVIEGSGPSLSVIENCISNVTIDVNGGIDTYVGGIAGKAAGSSIVDCRVETGDNSTSRIQGRNATVGGIAGFQNASDIYNSYVSGTIGGSGSGIVGGITGKYASGRMKVARFEGIIGQSGTGAAGHRGTFIGHREAGDYFRYGADVGFLFADMESKIAFNICGSGIPDDNEYTYSANIGYSHPGDPFYTLVQGGVSKNISDQYYYEVLEKGILSIIDEDHGGAGADEAGYSIDHFAPNDAGRPTRGYLITIPQIDTISSGTYYYDVAMLEARGDGSYYRAVNKGKRGAVAPGKSVTVTTSPNNTEEAKFQMDGVPTYTAVGGEKETTYRNGGEYTFTMPEENTEVKAVYKKVAARVSVVPSNFNISVIQERTGNRKNPVKTTKVLDHNGKLIASYINGALQQGTQIQPVFIQAVVDTNNDVADNSVKWSVDDPDLIILAANDDEDREGFTKKSASVCVNLNASFLDDTIRKLEKEQADNAYRYPIPDTIFGAGHQNGGVAVLTASTRPAASFEGKPCTGNCRINVTFQIKDKTYVANEGAVIDQEELRFTVTRRLTGGRKKPEERILVTPPQNLTASFSPDFFDRKDITWSVDDPAVATVDGENRSAGVSVRKDAKWIQDIIETDDGIRTNEPYAVLGGSGSRETKVTVTADDMLGNRQTANCNIVINFVTEDQTEVYAEGVITEPQTMNFELECTKSGKRSSPVISWTGDGEKKIKAVVLPEMAFNKACRFEVSDDSLKLDGDGTVTVNRNAKWIQDTDKTYPYTAVHTAIITATTEDGGFKAICNATIRYKLSDLTYGGSGGGKGGSSGGGSGSSSGVSPGGGIGPAGNGPAAGTSAPAGSVVGTWVNTEDGLWAFTANGRMYHNEWAYVHNPYAGREQSSTDWFRFDETGHMVSGWYPDTDGNLYYLWPKSDGTQGHMVTGWQWIAGADGLERRYYFNPEPDGTRGALLKNTTLPDGNQVNDKGEWTVEGVIQVRVPGISV